MSEQAHLQLGQTVGSSFDSFWPGPNRGVLAALSEFARTADEGQYVIVGPPSSGKSHLLRAACRQRWEDDRAATYLPVAQLKSLEASLQGVTVQGLVAVDGLEAMGADDELVLMRLIDAARTAGGAVLLSSRSWPQQLDLQIPDLATRLQWGASLELKALNDAELAELLQFRARALGVVLPPRGADFLLKRLRREPRALIGVLEQAYRLAVASGRQITVPLLREALASALAAHE